MSRKPGKAIDGTPSTLASFEATGQGLGNYNGGVPSPIASIEQIQSREEHSAILNAMNEK